MISTKYKLSPISNDASFRKFYRKKYDNRSLSTIVIFSKRNKFRNLFVYSVINQLLLKNNIKAPKLISGNHKRGFIEIEDFGDITFRNIIRKNRKKFNIYKKLVNLLIRVQKIDPKTVLNSIGKNYKLTEYSIKELQKESNLFFDWYLPLIVKKNKASLMKKILKKKLEILYKKLKFKNTTFVHRDFHVSNLMKVKDQIGLIDSQDAIIGNPTYDLLSLIDDVRIKTSNQLKNNILNYYLNKSLRIYKTKRKDFINDFNILSVQRSLKIIGIFSRLYKRDKKKQYLKLIPYTWSLLELRLKNEMFKEVRNILNQFISSRDRKKIKFYAN